MTDYNRYKISGGTDGGWGDAIFVYCISCPGEVSIGSGGTCSFVDLVSTEDVYICIKDVQEIMDAHEKLHH